MIAQLLRIAAEAWRNRRAPPAPPRRAPEVSVSDMQRLDLLRRSAEMAAEAQRLFDTAMGEPDFAERQHLFNRSIAAACRGAACHALAGGDHETAALNTIEAEGYDRRAGLRRVESAEPMEAAHA